MEETSIIKVHFIKFVEIQVLVHSYDSILSWSNYTDNQIGSITTRS